MIYLNLKSIFFIFTFSRLYNLEGMTNNSLIYLRNSRHYKINKWFHHCFFLKHTISMWAPRNLNTFVLLDQLKFSTDTNNFLHNLYSKPNKNPFNIINKFFHLNMKYNFSLSIFYIFLESNLRTLLRDIQFSLYIHYFLHLI